MKGAERGWGGEEGGFNQFYFEMQFQGSLRDDPYLSAKQKWHTTFYFLLADDSHEIMTYFL